MIVCSNCHTENPDGKNFCKECGTKLVPVEEFTGIGKDIVRKKRHWWLWLTIAILAVAAIGYIIIDVDKGMGSGSFKKKMGSTTNISTEIKLVDALIKSMQDQDDRSFIDNYCLTRADLSEFNSLLPKDERFNVKEVSNSFGEWEGRYQKAWANFNRDARNAGIDWSQTKVVQMTTEDHEDNKDLKTRIEVVLQTGDEHNAIYFMRCAKLRSGWKVCESIDWGGFVKGPVSNSVEEEVSEEQEGLDEEVEESNKSISIARQTANTRVESQKETEIISRPKPDITFTDELISLTSFSGESFKYKGDLKDGEANGKGWAEYEDGTIYEGNFKRNIKDGQGTVTQSNGVVFTGEFVNGALHGKGRYTWADGSYYVGDWDNGYRTGKGVYCWADGQRYEGDFEKGARTGQGVYYWPDGGKFEGSWIDGQRVKGLMVYGNKSRYEGEWKDNQPEGNGTITWPDGNKYIGQFKNGFRHGKGVFYWHDGQQYEGDFVENIRTGQGIYYWTDGKKYIGGFLNSEIHGTGTIYNSEGEITQQGRYENGKFVGK